MLSTPFERPIVLDLRRRWLCLPGPLIWTAGAVQCLRASIAIELKLGLLAWAVVWLAVWADRQRSGVPSAARWHPRSGWHLRFPACGWQAAALDGAHPIATNLQLFRWRSKDGRQWCRLVSPAAAPAVVRRRLRVLLRFGRLADDG